MAGKTLVSNRKARHDYEILDTMEAGIVLVGTEIKALRAGKAQLREGWIDIENGEAFLHNVHISAYSHGNQMNHDVDRRRKLLLHKAQIERLAQKVGEKGLTIIPLRFYLKNAIAKLELGIARGKKLYDKREAVKKREAGRQIERTLRERG